MCFVCVPPPPPPAQLIKRNSVTENELTENHKLHKLLHTGDMVTDGNYECRGQGVQMRPLRFRILQSLSVVQLITLDIILRSHK
jgi:hypothetical protein